MYHLPPKPPRSPNPPNRSSEPPRPISSFLSVAPLEPVLVFDSPHAAREFQRLCSTARVFPVTPNWVYLPMPRGLLRARPARLGDMSWEFEQGHQASEFNAEIGYVGTIYAPSREKPHIERNVYLGVIKK